MSDFHPVVAKIESLLDKEGVSFQRFEHEAVRTSEEASAIRPDFDISQGTKSLIVRVKKGGEKYFAMVVVPGDKKFYTKKVREVLGAKDIRFATEEEVSEVTDGVQVGGVPPFGNMFDIQTVVDERVFENEEIIFNAGDKRVSLSMKSEDYKSVVEPTIADVV